MTAKPKPWTSEIRTSAADPDRWAGRTRVRTAGLT